MIHVLGGLLDTGFVVGFGASGPDVFVSGAAIDLTGSPGLALNMAFSMPRDGTLVQLSAFYSNVVGVNIPAFSAVNVVVQLYRSATPDNIFSPVPGAFVTLTFPGPLLLGLGAVANGTAAFVVPVSNEDRLLLVARLTVDSLEDFATTLNGYVSAGLSIV